MGGRVKRGRERGPSLDEHRAECANPACRCHDEPAASMFARWKRQDRERKQKTN